MKRFFTLLALLATFSFQSFSQTHINYDRDSRWYFGINSGITWTSKAEMDYRIRGGYGFMLGHSFGMQPGKVFSWDLRGSFLHAWVVGQDTRRYLLDSTSSGLDIYGSSLTPYSDSIGFFIANHRTQLLNGSLELTLNTNRLRERTGLNLYLLGGVGITGYHTQTDLFDERVGSDVIYDYREDNFVNPSNQSNYLWERDRVYETDLAGADGAYKIDWMPNFGFGFSYQVTPYFALGLEYKKSWTRNNDFDGMENNLDGSVSNTNDIYHYFSGTMKFHLFNGNGTVITDPIDEPITDINNFDNTDPITNPIINNPPVQKPIVDITNPNSSPYSTDYDRFTITANIHYVSGRENVVFKQNGVVNNNFTYDANSDRFESNVILNPGQNLFEISGTNEAGMDYETTIIIYEIEDVKNPPIVTITNPPYSPYNTSNSVFAFSSTVLNVDSKSQIQVYFNGVSFPAFAYNTATDVLNATLTLMEGTNTITVTATNADGSDSKTAQIIYTKPIVEQPPVVSFIYPAVDPFVTSVNTINITASVLNVASKGNITVKINGNLTTVFNYNSSTKQVTLTTPLIEGANTVEIKGVNSVGQDIETTTIIYRKPETPQPPIVTFINPDVNPITVYSSSYNVTAKVEYVAAKENITLKINGIPTTLFTYSTSSKFMNFTTNLVEGSNIIEIKGVNMYGEDIEATTIIYKKQEPMLPPVVNISYPSTDNQVFMTPNMTLHATVLNVESALNIAVTVNGVSTTSFTYNNATKAVQLPLTLIEGANSVTIKGTNLVGTDTETRVIIYKKRIVPQPPTVTWLNPATSPLTVSVDNYILTASTTNIESKGQIVLKMNGMLVSSSAYTFTPSHQIIYNASLMNGNNIFEIIVTNDDGTASDVAVLNYVQNTEPCVIPTIGYVSPVPFSTVTEAAVTIDAQINNHSAGTTIELLQNGVSKGFMTYNSSTSIASKGIVLAEGSNSIKVVVTNDCGTNQSNFTLVYKVAESPCNPPTIAVVGPLSFTTDATSTALSAITSNVPSADNISILKNGGPVDFSFDMATGSITIDPLTLSVGLNTILIKTITACGSDEKTILITREVCETPVISGLSHESGVEIEATSINFTANVSNALSSDIYLIINGISQPFTYNESTGSLTSTVNLNVGLNNITISVNTACGKNSKTILVNRKVPCSEIETNFISPASSTVSATTSDFTILLHTSNISSSGDVTATFNGVSIPFTFDAISGNITVSGITLNDGTNTLSISLKNACSSTKIDYTINYDGCKPAEVSLVGIADGLSVEGNSLTISGTISNVADPSIISLKVNGIANDFAYNPVSNAFSADLSLTYGVNSVVLLVDGCKRITKTFSITATMPCTEISTAPISPAIATITTTEAIYAISFSALGITDASQVIVKHNGIPVAFTFDAGTHIVNVPVINLIEGSNVVNVSLNNSCSSGELQYSINYNGCNAPVITFNPHESSVSSPSFTFSGSVTNISASSDLVATLNGVPISLIYNAATNSFESSVELNEGANTITIIANGCESTSGSFTVNYTAPCEEITYSLFRPATLTQSVSEPNVRIMLNAFGVEVSGITVTANGVSVPFTFVSNRITFFAEGLVSGLNNVVVTLNNGCSTQTINYAVTYSDCTSPTISLLSAPSASEVSTYSFTATVLNVEASENITVKLNGDLKEFSYDPTTGLLSSTLTLIEGTNEIRILAMGCEAYEHYFSVLYSVPCLPVTYSLVSPAMLTSIVEEDDINISLLTTNISSASDITVTLNGTSIPFAFTIGNIDINDISLSEGLNTITVTFGNACSSETVTYLITKPGCEAPSIALTSTTTTVEVSSYSFAASITNVTDASTIQLLVNGKPVPFTFNPDTHALTAGLTLNEGINNVTLIANGCSTSTANYILTYTTPCVPLTYSLVSPTALTNAVTSSSYAISLNATNVVTSGISVTLNGSTIPFTYNSSTITINGINLSEGVNTIAVVMANDCSSQTVAYAITYTPAFEPCGPRFNPGNSTEEFCLVTPSGTFSRDDLAANPSFTYVGPASAVYFKPIAGGGSAKVAGSEYPVANGKYYLFEGVINVNVSSSHPGSMGHWEICIESSSAPTFGVGASKPESPCAADDKSREIIEPGSDRVTVTAKPTISMQSPTGATATSSQATYTVKGLIENVSTKSDIKIFVNGVSFSGFTYTPASKQLNAIVRLNAGENKIKIEAKNGDQITTKEFIINYVPKSTGTGTGTERNTNTGTGSGTQGKNTGTGTNTNSGGTTGTNSGRTTNTGGGTTTTTGGGTNSSGTGTNSGRTTNTGGGTTTTTGSKTTTGGGTNSSGTGTNSGRTTNTGGGTNSNSSGTNSRNGG